MIGETVQTCALCRQSTPPASAFCVSCGHERIVNSLSAPVTRPAWLDRALLVSAALVGIWLMVTIGVAFLREAKAIRWARTALADGKPAKAQDLILPFLEKNPKHVEGLYIGGASAIAVGPTEQAEAYFFALSAMEENRKAASSLEELKVVYNASLVGQAGQLDCGQESFSAFFARYEKLFQHLDGALIRSAAASAKKCVLIGNPRMANEPGFWLIHSRGLDAEQVVNALYLEPLRPALEKGEYRRVGALAVQAQGLLPSTKPVVDEILQATRERTSLNFEKLKTACLAVLDNPVSRTRRSTCYPAESPAVLSEHQDAWGRSFEYVAQSPSTGTCMRSFTLISKGADGKIDPPDNNRRSYSATSSTTPNTDITCRPSGYGRNTQLSPRFDPFWLRSKS